MSVADAFAVLDQQARLGVTELHEAAQLWPKLMERICNQYPFKRYPLGVQRRLKRMGRKARDRVMGFDGAAYNEQIRKLIQEIKEGL